MKGLKHVIFDLDHTLWDFEKNSNYVLKFLFDKYQLQNTLQTSFDQYQKRYHEITNNLWHLYDTKRIGKEELRNERIPQVFASFNHKDGGLTKKIETEYLEICPDQSHLIEGTIDILQYIAKKYTAHILTNGFKSIQHRKLKASGVSQYFKTIVTSECSGYSKPDEKAFKFLLEKISANANECIMVGDNNLSDIEGSHNIGMKSIYFNPKNQIDHTKATYAIKNLLEIKKLI